MSQNIAVSFKASGTELSAYMDSIKKKSEDLTNSAIKGAQAQTDAGKQQIAIINQQIAAIERKSKIENQAARSIALEQREAAIKANADKFEGRRNEVFSNNKLSEQDKKERIVALDGSERAGSDKIKSDYRDNLTILKEQERQAKMQTALSRENIDAIKQTARENVKAITVGDKKLEDVIGGATTEEEQLVARLTQQELKENKRKETNESKPGLFGELMAVDNINKIISTAGQMAQSKNGFDLIQPASNMAGRIIGGIIGGVVGSIVEPGGGTLAGAGLGAEVGGGLGDALGVVGTREAMAKENFKKSAFRYQAITGSNVDTSAIPDMSQSGVNYTEYMGMRSDMARRRGNREDSDKTTRDAIYADKGLGVDQGTSAGIIELQRSSKESNRDLASLIGGVVEKGSGSIFKNGDTTFLNEFLGKFTSFQKELLKTNTNVSSGTTMDVMKQFNSMGGMFDAKDPRSSGVINSIQSSLSNPSSDNLKALSFGVLRKQHPNMGVFDMREEMQKGLGSPEYLKGMIGMVDRMGGDDQAKMNNLSGMFPGMPLAAVKTLFNGRKNLKKFDTKELKGIGLTDDVIRGKSEANTTVLDKNAAGVENGFLKGGENDAKALVDAFSAAVKETLGDAVIVLKNGQGTINLKGIKKNVTKSPKDSNPKNFKFDAGGADMAL
jgi:hypothetical protein